MADRSGSETSALLSEMAAAVAGAAPEGWVGARLRHDVGDDGQGPMTLSYAMPEGATRKGRKLDLTDVPGKVRRLAGASGGKLRITLEVAPEGRFTATVGGDEHGPTLYLLDPDAVPAEPGDEQDGPAAPAPAGDPEEAVRLFREYLRKRAEIIGTEEELPPPADEEDLDAAEEELGFPLPADLRALYRVCDGDDDLGLLFRYGWLTAGELADHDDEWAMISREWEYDQHRRILLDPVPAGAVRRSIMRPGWIPFAHSTGGDFYAVDMDPGPAGRPGQVISIGTHHAHGPVYIADSVTTLVRRLVEALERGDHTYERGDLRYEDELPSHLEAEDDAILNLSEAPSPGPRPLVQKISATGLDDLGFVREMPALRAVELSAPAEVDLAPLLGVPLEILTLEAPSIDLRPLTGRRSLRSLTLFSQTAVDLAPLREFPGLWALDISSAPVENIRAIADLESLSYLCLRLDQWDELDGLEVDVLAIKESTRLDAGRTAWKTSLLDAPPRTYAGSYPR
ncbi:SMI1/KNR4 family protein [Actinomadura xylanilytica]|uniref:SMI1/KNR4 family protein n=1 Tax=Actinomadura xylanilytica TaxID=887459 RepID=UPI00255B3F4E|nr:SMI1/KNR4 family protein [Actinomadura xylanilytica]MDL4773645.1 SMI1/KNR4 family protein [Actinomadura xylanilytica]